MRVESDAKFEEKLALGFKNDMINLVNFNASSGKSENLHFDVLRYNFTTFLSWHWRVIQTLKKNSLFVWKMT